MTSQIQSNVNNSEFSKIFKSRETLVEILHACDYDVSGYKSVSERHLHSMINNKQLDMELEKTDKSSKIYIQSYYILGKSSKKDAIPSIVDDLFHIERRLTT